MDVTFYEYVVPMDAAEICSREGSILRHVIISAAQPSKVMILRKNIFYSSGNCARQKLVRFLNEVA